MQQRLVWIMRFFQPVDKVFRITLAMVLVFQNVAQAMQNPNFDDHSHSSLAARLSALDSPDEREDLVTSLSSQRRYGTTEPTAMALPTDKPGEVDDGEPVDLMKVAEVEAQKEQRDEASQSFATPTDHLLASAIEIESSITILTRLTESRRRLQESQPSNEGDELATLPELAMQLQEDIPDDNMFSKKLRQIETSWRGILRWAYMDSLLQRMGYFLALGREEITLPDDQKKCCSCPVWLSGGSFPITSERARKRALFIDGLRQGAEFVIFRTIHTGITALTIYQFYNYMAQKTPLPCQNPLAPHSFEGLIKFWESSDDKVLLGLFHDILGKQNNALSYLKYLFFTPLAWGLSKGVWNTSNSSLSSDDIANLLKEIEGNLDDTDLSRQTEGIKPGFYNDVLRWGLPLHPLDRKLGQLIKNVLWNPNVSSEDLQKIWKCLQTLVTDHRGYTSITALAHVMKIAYGLNARDLIMFGKKTEHQMEESSLLPEEEEYATLDDLAHRMRMKTQAFALLQEESSFRKIGQQKTFGRKVSGGLSTLYAQYLLWSLGVPRSWPEAIAPTLFKAGKLYVQAKLIQTIVNAFLEAEKCPQQPGVSMAGIESWASDLTQACFNASVKAFNIIPGQPTDTLVGNLGQYYFQDCDVALDLSNKGLSGEAVANITRALLNHNITFSFLNLSGNSINTVEDFDFIFPVLGDVTTLDLSNNGIGWTDSLGTISLGNVLSHCYQLNSLDLSNNGIGFTDSNGTVALGEGLSHLPNLTFLDLSNNYIGYKDSNGTVALGKSLRYLSNLTFLDLSNDRIDFMDSNGITSLGEGLHYLPNLTFLDLSNNFIGYKDSNGIVALSEGLSHLPNLVSLDLSTNAIGWTNSTTVKTLISSLYYLHHLKNFGFLPNFINNTDIIEINKALNYTLAPLLQTIIITPDDANTYCQSLPSSVQYCNLSRIVPFPNSKTIRALMQCLQSKKHLSSLDLSYNGVGSIDSNASVALGEGLSYFPNLTFLDLSNNHIGLINSLGVVALGEGLRYLPNLTFLDLSTNAMDFKDSTGTITLGQSLSHLPNLTFLDLSTNAIGFTSSNGTVALGEGLSHLPNLTFLDLSNNFIGFTSSNGTVALGEGLSHLPNLTSLDFFNNHIGFTNSLGTIMLAKGFNQTRNLQVLNLGGNMIGSTSPDGSQMLISVLLNLPNLKLESLNIADMTNISWTNASQYLLNRRTQAMMDACQVSRCFGGAVQTSSAGMQDSQVSIFSTQRHLMSLDNGWDAPASSSASSRPFMLSQTVSSFYNSFQNLANSPEATYMMIVAAAQLVYQAGLPLLATYLAIEG